MSFSSCKFLMPFNFIKGFAKQSFELIPGAKLEDLNDIMAIDCKSSMAAMLNVSPEKLEFMTAEEYEHESEDEDDE